jgi:uncharacterized protein (DUF362 family)
MKENRPEKRQGNGITRRQLVITGAAAGALAASGLGFGRTDAGTEEAQTAPPDLAVATGKDAVANLRAAIAAMGGMGAFVSAGQVVNLLPNAQGTHPGTSTSPEIVRTVVEMCREAGAKDVRWLTWISGKYWDRSNIGEYVEASGATLVKVDPEDEAAWRSLEVPRGKALSEVRVFDALWDCDVFITMPIIKDHVGSRFTGSLKNYMGASHPVDNRLFHPTFQGEDLVHMEQCIADLNTVVREPDLIIADAMTILTSKGPFGPGDIAEPQKVFAGVDRVAVDAYGATLLGLDGAKVDMIRMAHEHGLGRIDLEKLRIESTEVA